MSTSFLKDIRNEWFIVVFPRLHMQVFSSLQKDVVFVGLSFRMCDNNCKEHKNVYVIHKNEDWLLKAVSENT